jgi:hypothetical protein
LIVFFLVVFLSFFTYYFLNNPISDNTVNNCATQINIYFDGWIKDDKKTQDELDKVLLINVANDKELVSVSERYIPKGTIAITDRLKLAQFLYKLNDQHQYIICDIIFSKKYGSPNDSLLQSAFKKTKRIIVPAPIYEDSIGSPKFDVGFGASSYKASIESNRFMKYTFTEGDSLKSIPLIMYNDLYGKDIIRKGGRYYSNGKLCMNSILLNFKIRPPQKYSDDLNNLQILELGEDILNGGQNDTQFQELIKDKIILIGDFEDSDQHRTIYGKMPGVLINYNAFLALKNSDHVIPRSLMLFLIILYLKFSLIMVYRWDKLIIVELKNRIIKCTEPHKKLNKIIVNLPKINILELLFNFSIYIALLGIISVFIFLIYGIQMDLLAMSATFTIINGVRNAVFEYQENIKKYNSFKDET